MQSSSWGNIAATLLCEKVNFGVDIDSGLGREYTTWTTWRAKLLQKELDFPPLTKPLAMVFRVSCVNLLACLSYSSFSLFGRGLSGLWYPEGFNLDPNMYEFPMTYLLRCTSWIKRYIFFFNWLQSSMWWPLTLCYLHHLFGSFLIISHLKVRGLRMVLVWLKVLWYWRIADLDREKLRS